MGNRNGLTRILAFGGTVLVWFPVAAPILFAAALWIRMRAFHFDYLMPAEFFPLVLVGGGMLAWASVRARSRRKLIGWGFGAAAGVLILGQALAVITGLASGRLEPGGWQWTLVLGSIIVYTLALIATGVGGILLLSDLSNRHQPLIKPSL